MPIDDGPLRNKFLVRLVTFSLASFYLYLCGHIFLAIFLLSSVCGQCPFGGFLDTSYHGGQAVAALGRDVVC